MSAIAKDSGHKNGEFCSNDLVRNVVKVIINVAIISENIRKKDDYLFVSGSVHSS